MLCFESSASGPYFRVPAGDVFQCVVLAVNQQNRVSCRIDETSGKCEDDRAIDPYRIGEWIENHFQPFAVW